MSTHDWPEPIATLLRDHQTLRALLQEAEYAVAGQQASSVQAAVDRLEEAVARHAMKEERGLFPFLTDEETQELASPLYPLITEHQELAQYFARLREALGTSDAAASRAAVEALAEFLLHHFAMEESAIFPWVVEHLSDEALQAAHRQIEYIARLGQ